MNTSGRKSNSQQREHSRASYTPQTNFTPQQISRLEWWLWFSALLVTTLSAVAFGLTWMRSLFRTFNHFYEINSEQARWATLSLLLLFNSWMLLRQWNFRRMRKHSWAQPLDPQNLPLAGDSAGLDPVTGLLTRGALENLIGKEVARARRQNTALSLATIHVDDFTELKGRHGQATVDAALKELARLLKKASRGSDFAARISEDDFILLLPECGVNEVRQVLNRLGTVEINSSGVRLPLTYTTGWVDYQPGDLPADLLKRAANLLHLYDIASQSSAAQSYGPH
ncbi:MAG TPA: GGDEF domain-containing protein [Candidatus Acidoferrum sp.]|nr:GGDEF domain-containing protein [Candidatus Acidoferrum sp.]